MAHRLPFPPTQTSGPSTFLNLYNFCLVKDNRTPASLARETEAIERAGGQVSFDLAKVTHIVVKLPPGAGNVWHCNDVDRTPAGSKTEEMTLGQLLLSAHESCHVMPDIVTHEFLDMWLLTGRQPKGNISAAWTVTLLPPHYFASMLNSVAGGMPNGAPSVDAEPRVGGSLRMSQSSLPRPALPLNVGTEASSWARPIIPPVQVFRDVGSCTFYVAPGCAAAVPWLIKCMGGQQDTARRALYVIVPDINGDAALYLGPLHPSGSVLDEMFVFDCLRYGSFQSLDKYRANLGPPSPQFGAVTQAPTNVFPTVPRPPSGFKFISRTNRPAVPEFSPLLNAVGGCPHVIHAEWFTETVSGTGTASDNGRPIVVPYPVTSLPRPAFIPGPSNYQEHGTSNQLPRSSHWGSSTLGTDRHEPVPAEHAKRSREDEDEEDGENYETRRRVHDIMDERWKDDFPLDIKKEERH
ncbi:uncharacterized protein LOC62_07G009441 [Vanrija pseudolonga]|uniref:BRCT domain-containing protein n=1 Tax=Vanrija pseudolonga TaxID=143232 RepID=A0AAF0YHX1_9TREE|nr:hypothetical protein LOC62_07G009441 [Vanrija pseudolonga]